MKARLLFISLLLLAAVPVSAQTISRTLAWTHLNDVLATTTSYTFTLKIDAAAATAITPTCQTAGANVNCSTPITLTAGNHTIIVTATNAGGSASGTLNYVPPAGPTTPSSLQITIQITVP